MSATRRTAWVVAVLALVAVAGVGAASAYWTRGGSGSGAATTNTPQAVVLSPAAPSSQLYPGGTADVALTATNPAPGSVRILSLGLDTSQGTGGFTVDAAHAGCGVSALSFTTQSNGGAGWAVAGNASSAITLTGSLAMSADASDACQGASFTVYLAAGP
jgi:hypothetical protein